MRQSPEILAPAGSMEALTAAVHCGADAVYIGATLFSARQNAHNFDAAALQEAADFCHTNGVKLYLTVNTLVFDTEWTALDELLQTAAAVGMDACIVQDLGVADYIHQRIPEMPLHASTQMTICSPSGAIWAKEHGFSRVVVAREMTRSEIQAVCAIGLEVEQFVHGALCMCISGQSYLSALIGARSANRGCCAQACRLPFTAAKNPQAAALSLKDLCLLPHYQQLCADGIASLKIEGRMKRPEYVAAAVTALRQLKEGKQPDLQMLRAVFSRSGFTDGYYTGQRKQMFGVRQKEDVTAANAVLPKLAELAKKNKLDVRFIELMPIGQGRAENGISGAWVLGKLKEAYGIEGEFYPLEGRFGNGPAVYYQLPGFQGKIGLISALHGKFCDRCNRIRMTSTGKLKACLCYADTISVFEAARHGSEEEIRKCLEQAIRGKPKMHHFEEQNFITEQKNMSQIGG